MATAETNLDKLKSNLNNIKDQIKTSRIELNKPDLSKKNKTEINNKLSKLNRQQTTAMAEIAKCELKLSNSQLKQSQKENTRLKAELEALKKMQPPSKKQKLKHNNIDNKVDDEIDSQAKTQSISSGSDDKLGKFRDIFDEITSWWGSRKGGIIENNLNNQNNQERIVPQNTEITEAMKTRIISNSRINELKEVQTYKGIKFSGMGADRYIKAAEFLTSIRNFERQGRMIFGFKEDYAIRSVRSNGFTDNAALIVAQAVPQAIETFDEFYHWFENTWDMSTARQELYIKFNQFKMPSNMTPDELGQHIKHYKQIFDSIGNKCSQLVLAQTTLKEVDVINGIYNTMCKEWQLAYDEICKLYFRPLDLHSFIAKLSKLTNYIIEYNATHTQQPIPLQSPTTSNINKLYQQPSYTPPFKGGFANKGRQKYPRTSDTFQPSYKSPKTNTNIQTPTKTYKEPYYLDAWCPICSMGGHTKRFHWVISKKYPKKQMEFAAQYQQKRAKQQINKIQQGVLKNDHTNAANKESITITKTITNEDATDEILQDTTGMKE